MNIRKVFLEVLGVLPPSEREEHEKIPFAFLDDDFTVVTKDGLLMQVIKLDGFSVSEHDETEISREKLLRSDILREIANPNLAVYTHTISRAIDQTLSGQYEGFASELDEAWKSSLKARGLYVTEHYITLVRSVYSGAQGVLKNLFGNNSRGRAQYYYEQQEAISELEKTVLKVVSKLTHYGSKRLSVVERKGAFYSEILGFFGELINGEIRDYPLKREDISHCLPTVRKIFRAESIEYREAAKTRYSAILAIKEYPAQTREGIIDSIFTLPFEVIVTQSFSFIERHKAINMLETHKRELRQAKDSEKLQFELEELKDEVQAGDLHLGYHHFTINVFSDTKTGLIEAINKVNGELKHGIISVREDTNLEAAFWSQLPGNQSFLARKAPISSDNYAGFASFHSDAHGSKTGNHWGECVTVFPTKDGSPYYFNWHKPGTDVGHTSIIAPTGSGKTALLCFLLALTLKFNPRIIYFDKDRAGEPFIRSLGGTYQIINPERKAGFNPLLLSDTKVNRSFLEDWLTLLLTANGERLSASERERVHKAIERNYTLERYERRLEVIASYLGIGELPKRLGIWYGEGSRAYLFDNEVDELDLSSEVSGLDLGYLLKDNVARVPVMAYLFHRIESVLDGRKTVISIDEGWAYVREKYFEERLEEQLKTIRKKEGIIVFTATDPKDAINSGISSALTQEIGTNIFFANPKARKEDYIGHFNLTDKQYLTVKGMHISDRQALVVQDKSSAVIDVDMTAISEFIPLLSARAETIAMIDQIKSDNTAQWVREFKEMAGGLV